MATKYNRNIQFPTDSNFVNRILSVDFSPSKSSGNPMITMKAEVVSPSVVDVGGDDVNIAGVQTINYFTTTVMDGDSVDAAKTAEKRKSFSEVLVSLGVDVTTLDWDNLNLSQLKGKCILTQMNSEVDYQRKNPTTKQLEEAKAKGVRAEGDVMKNPVTGKDEIFYKPRIVKIYALAPEGVAGGAGY